MWWWVPVAGAHEIGLSYARIEADALTLVFAGAEVAAVGEPPVLRVDGVPCAVGTLVPLGTVETDGIGFRAPLACPDGSRWTMEAPYLDGLAPGHRQVVTFDGEPVGTAAAGEVLTFGEAGPGATAAEFVGLGVEHVLTGWDHLAFLFGLLLVARGGREVLGIVTGFTVAHSLTLSLAALDVLALPARIVEPAIAASVAWVGLENRWNPPPRRRLVLTFALGLVHGFGFAGLLGELGLPSDHRVLALLCFNVGVELGQIGVVALVLPVLLALRERETWITRAVPALSSALVVLGGYWFVARIAAP